MSGVMSSLVGAGGSAFTGTNHMVAGVSGDHYGYFSETLGTLVPSTWGGSRLKISRLDWEGTYPMGTGTLLFGLNTSTILPNAGWSTLEIVGSGAIFNRTDAYFNNTSWWWFNVDNPFPFDGFTTDVVWA